MAAPAANPYNEVPLGQAGTGAAFVLNPYKANLGILSDTIAKKAAADQKAKLAAEKTKINIDPLDPKFVPTWERVQSNLNRATQKYTESAINKQTSLMQLKDDVGAAENNMRFKAGMQAINGLAKSMDDVGAKIMNMNYVVENSGKHNKTKWYEAINKYLEPLSVDEERKVKSMMPSNIADNDDLVYMTGISMRELPNMDKVREYKPLSQLMMKTYGGLKLDQWGKFTFDSTTGIMKNQKGESIQDPRIETVASSAMLDNDMRESAIDQYNRIYTTPIDFSYQYKSDPIVDNKLKGILIESISPIKVYRGSETGGVVGAFAPGGKQAESILDIAPDETITTVSGFGQSGDTRYQAEDVKVNTRNAIKISDKVVPTPIKGAPSVAYNVVTNKYEYPKNIKSYTVNTLAEFLNPATNKWEIGAVVSVVNVADITKDIFGNEKTTYTSGNVEKTTYIVPLDPNVSQSDQALNNTITSQFKDANVKIQNPTTKEVGYDFVKLVRGNNPTPQPTPQPKGNKKPNKNNL